MFRGIGPYSDVVVYLNDSDKEDDSLRRSISVGDAISSEVSTFSVADSSMGSSGEPPPPPPTTTTNAPFTTRRRARRFSRPQRRRRASASLPPPKRQQQQQPRMLMRKLSSKGLDPLPEPHVVLCIEEDTDDDDDAEITADTTTYSLDGDSHKQRLQFLEEYSVGSATSTLVSACSSEDTLRTSNHYCHGAPPNGTYPGRDTRRLQQKFHVMLPPSVPIVTTATISQAPPPAAPALVKTAAPALVKTAAPALVKTAIPPPRANMACQSSDEAVVDKSNYNNHSNDKLEVHPPIATALSAPPQQDKTTSEPTTEKPRPFKWRRRIFLLVTTVILTAVLVIVVIIIMGGGNLSPRTGASAPGSTLPPFRVNETRSILLFMNVSSSEDLYNTSTPQYQALKWLADDDPARLDLSSTPINILQERYVVALLYFATITQGSNWTRMYHFLSENSICSWNNETDKNGVLCNADDNTTQEINLAANGLNGFLPSEIGKLAHLQVLNVAKNNLVGMLPDTIGNLTNLAELNVSSNGIHGPIPSNVGSLSHLQHFSMFENKLTGTIPSEMGLLQSIVSLNLFGNHLTGALPTEIGQLEKITSLDCHNNSLNGTMPSEIQRLSNLYDLSLSENRLQGNLIWLSQLIGKGNRNWIPPTGQNHANPSVLQNLKSLFLDYNLLTGRLPSEIALLQQIVTLTMSNNQFDGPIPSEIGNLTSLQILKIDHNQLNGTLPSSLASLGQLLILEVGFNLLSGTVPSEYCQLSSLTSLGLENNTLSGTLPSSLAATCISNLKTLHIQSNKFRGSLESFCERHMNDIQADCDAVNCSCCSCCQRGCDQLSPPSWPHSGNYS